jgi:hypothetical protein
LLWQIANDPLKSLKKADLPEEEEEEEARHSSEAEVVAALGTKAAKGGKELYYFLG